MTLSKKKAFETAKIAGIARTAESAKAAEVSEAGKDGEESEGKYLKNLIWVSCIWYPINFQKKSIPVLVLFDSDSKINTIYPTFVKELSFFIRPTNIEAQKIDSIMLDIFEMVVVAFLLTNTAN